MKIVTIVLAETYSDAFVDLFSSMHHPYETTFANRFRILIIDVRWSLKVQVLCTIILQEADTICYGRMYRKSYL